MSETLRVLAADDEPLALDRTARLLAQLAGVELVGRAANGEEALAMIRELTPDVVLLDISMPLLDGFDVIEQPLGAAPPAIIFVTAFHRFAVKAFEVAAADYILKPVRLARLAAALDRVRAARAAPDPAAMKALAASIRETTRSDEDDDLWVQRRGEYLRVALPRLDRISAEGEYVRLHVGAETYLYREPIGQLAERLAVHGFIRIHRSAVVRGSFVSAARRTRYGRLAVRLADGSEAAVGRKYASAVRALIHGAA
ncbi:LytR/AlgR family response regulator transcription factor [Sphingoaurantiacus capsulatus]|uniref:LytR/AlgR family response regulator transcription factor n=1 Tax=Sphingoaurantiacus capsulatus TaxID=1771310 RepID=A0ABV7X577_9SPHN